MKYIGFAAHHSCLVRLCEGFILAKRFKLPSLLNWCCTFVAVVLLEPTYNYDVCSCLSGACTLECATILSQSSLTHDGIVTKGWHGGRNTRLVPCVLSHACTFSCPYLAQKVCFPTAKLSDGHGVACPSFPSEPWVTKAKRQVRSGII